MDKIKVNSRASFGFMMPVVLVGADVSGIPNFLTAAWIMRCEGQPPKLAVALAPHHTNLGIERHGQFSVSIPGAGLVRQTDFCGIASGNRTDKSGLFTIFRGELDHAPMVAECPVAMECLLNQKTHLDKHTLYIGEVVNIYADESRMVDDVLSDAEKDTILLSSEDRCYYAPGEFLARGWSCGKGFEKGLE